MSIPTNVRSQQRCLHGSKKTYRLALLAMAVSVAGTTYAADAKADAKTTAAKPAATKTSEAKTGQLTGRVLNVGNGMYLSKALVKVEGTKLEALTDDYGNFTLDDVPVGQVTLSVSFTGLQPSSQKLDVFEGLNMVEDIKLSRVARSGSRLAKDADVVEMDEFVVQQERYKNAAEIAIQEERYSPNLKNVVSADAFGNMPDGNVAEFVKYIPGVQINYGYDNGASGASNNNASSISVRGFGPEYTAITLDGVPLTNATPASLTHAVGVDMMSINNASRVEVIKVPTPDMPSNSPGGAINLITRSAFEYARPSTRFNVQLSSNTDTFFKHNITDKTGGPANHNTYKVLPGGDISYVLPVNKKVGVTFSGGWSSTSYINRRFTSDYYFDLATDSSGTSTLDLTPGGGSVYVKGGGALQSIDGKSLTLANPVMRRYSIYDMPNIDDRTSAAIKVDLKPNPYNVITIGYSLGLFSTVDAQNRLQFYEKAGYYKTWDATSSVAYDYLPKGTVANGKTLTSAFGGGTMDMDVVNRDREASTHTAYINYTFTKGAWKITANASYSRSRGGYEDMQNNHFSEVENQASVGSVSFYNINNGRPGVISIKDTSGNAVDYTQLANWPAMAASSLTAKSGQTESLDEHKNFKFDVRRDLDFIPLDWITMSFKTGFYRDQERQKKWGTGTGYTMTYYGPTVAATDLGNNSYKNISPGNGYPAQQWISTYKLYDIYTAHPEYFNSNSTSDQYNDYASWANQQKNMTETSDQYYTMLDGKALHNRLTFMVGARKDVEARKGYMTVTNGNWAYVENANGTIYRDSAYPNGIAVNNASSDIFATTAAGVALRSKLDSLGISYPTSVITKNTLAYAQRYLMPFYQMDSTVQGKPSIMAAIGYDITKDLTVKFSYSRTYAQPDIENTLLSSNGSALTITEASDPNAVPAGTINIPNPNLKPWTSDGFDLDVSYYTKSGGKFSVSPYMKHVTDFQESWTIDSSNPLFASTLAKYNLDASDYEGYYMTSKYNGNGADDVYGCELGATQNLKILGSWGQYFYVFANASRQYEKKDTTNVTDTTAVSLASKPTGKNSANFGVSFNYRRLSILVRGNYVQERYVKSGTSYTYNGTKYATAYYMPSQTKLDMDIRYKLSKNYSAFFSERSFNHRYMDQSFRDGAGIVPYYAQYYDRKDTGYNFSLGITGEF